MILEIFPGFKLKAASAKAAEQGAVPADGAAGHGRAAAAAGNKNRKRGFTPQK